jgi:hypothetical protein
VKSIRITGSSDAVMADKINELLRKFEYPDSDTTAAPFQGGGGGGAPRFVVAASDASADSKRKADYTVLGSGDQADLQSIVNEFGNAGGLLILTEGTYDFTDSWTVSGPTWVRGMGTGATFLIGSIDTGALVLPGANGKLSDMYVENSSADSNAEGVRMTGERGLMDNCRVVCNGLVAIRMAEESTTVRSCFAEESTYGIRHTAGERIHIIDNLMENVTTGIEVNDNLAQVRGNIMFTTGDGIAGTGDNGMVIGNVIDAGGTAVSYSGTNNTTSPNTIV